MATSFWCLALLIALSPFSSRCRWSRFDRSVPSERCLEAHCRPPVVIWHPRECLFRRRLSPAGHVTHFDIRILPESSWLILNQGLLWFCYGFAMVLLGPRMIVYSASATKWDPGSLRPQTRPTCRKRNKSCETACQCELWMNYHVSCLCNSLHGTRWYRCVIHVIHVMHSAYFSIRSVPVSLGIHKVEPFFAHLWYLWYLCSWCSCSLPTSSSIFIFGGLSSIHICIFFRTSPNISESQLLLGAPILRIQTHCIFQGPGESCQATSSHVRMWWMCDGVCDDVCDGVMNFWMSSQLAYDSYDWCLDSKAAALFDLGFPPHSSFKVAQICLAPWLCRVHQ